MQSTESFLGAGSLRMTVPETQAGLGKSLQGLGGKGVSHPPAVAKESPGPGEAPGASC